MIKHLTKLANQLDSLGLVRKSERINELSIYARVI